MKRISVCLVIVMLAVLISTASAFADHSLVGQGEACLQAEPPEYEEAAQLFRRAGLQGEGEGYYRLARMYDEGLLVVGNPCTDDIATLGRQKAEEYYKLAAENGYEGIADPGWRSISQDTATEWDMSISPEITEEIQSIFDRAMENLTGVNYTPVAVLGVMDDTYCILCKAAVVYPGAKPYNALVYVNENGIQNIYELWIEKHAAKEDFDDGTSNCA